MLYLSVHVEIFQTYPHLVLGVLPVVIEEDEDTLRNQLPPSLLVAPSKMKIRTSLPPYLLLYLLMISLLPSLLPLPPRTFLPLPHLLWLLRMSLSLCHLLHLGPSKKLASKLMHLSI